MTLNSIQWDLDIVAQSSIVHRHDHGSTGGGTFVLFRREKIITPNAETVEVPIISGSSFRGILRRIGEEFTADILSYEDQLPVPAAHLLTNGGRPGKSAHPLTDEQERHLKHLIPQIAVFGGAAGPRIMSGLTAVGKVLPEIDELAHLLPRPPAATLPAGRTLDAEAFTHLNDHRPDTRQAPHPDSPRPGSKGPLGRFGIETLPAGTRLQSWVRISNATDVQAAFLHDIVVAFASRGHLGGRTSAGHGRITADVTANVIRGRGGHRVSWTRHLTRHREDALAALRALT